MSTPADRYRIALAEWLDCRPENLYFFWKGRVALYAILRAMGVGPGDEVVLPAFTCVVVPNAILYCGALPRYVDIDRETLNATPEAIEKAITPRTRAIICQNTLGLASDTQGIAALARARGVFSIEDCAHGFGGTTGGARNGTICDASFFSTQWNKPFSSGLGGIALVKEPGFVSAMEKVERKAGRPSVMQVLLLRGLLASRRLIDRPSLYWPLVNAYRRLGNWNFVPGSSSREEISGVRRPDGYFRLMSTVQMRAGLRSLSDLKAVMALRRQNAQRYSEYLAARGKWHVSDAHAADHAFLRYPIFVNQRDRILKEAARAKIPVGDWFNSPLHPVKGNLVRWGLDRERVPTADTASRHILNLPTDLHNMEQIMNFLDQIGDRIR